MLGYPTVSHGNYFSLAISAVGSTGSAEGERRVRILNISAQKPDGTGSGTFLAQTVAAQVAAGHLTAVICGIDDGDATDALPAQTLVFPVRFNTSELPFHVCGMSDEMPYVATRYRDLTSLMVGQFESAFAARLDRALAEFRPDVVICHHLYLLASIVRERVSGVPVAAVCHATDLRQMAMHDLERDRIIAAIRRMDALFCLHRAQAAEIVRVYGADPARVHVTGTGYNAHVFNQDGDAVRRRAGQRQMSSNSPPWSRFRATGTLSGSAMALTIGAQTSGVAFMRIWRGETSRMTADFFSAAAMQAALTRAKLGQLGAGTA